MGSRSHSRSLSWKNAVYGPKAFEEGARLQWLHGMQRLFYKYTKKIAAEFLGGSILSALFFKKTNRICYDPFLPSDKAHTFVSSRFDRYVFYGNSSSFGKMLFHFRYIRFYARSFYT